MPKSVFDVDVLFSLRQPTVRVPMHISPDGSLLALSSQSKRRKLLAADREDAAQGGIPIEAIGSRVLVLDTSTGEALEPFAKEETSWGAQWSPDGKLLAAYVAEGGTPVLAVWHRDSGRVQKFERAPVRPFFGFEVPRWTPDCRSIVVKLLPSDFVPDATGPAAGDGAPQTVGPGPERKSFLIRPGRAYLRLPQAARPVRALSMRPRPGGCDHGEVRRLAVGWSLAACKVAPDGSSVAVLKHAGRNQQLMRSYFDLVVVPLARQASHGSWLPECRRSPSVFASTGRRTAASIAFTTAEHEQPARLFVVRADGTGPPVDLTDPHEDMDLSRDYEAPRWTTGGGRILCLAHDGYWEFAPDGSYRRKVRPNLDRQIVGWVQRPTGSEVWTPAGDESLLLITQDPATKNTGLARVDLNSGESHLVTEFPKRLAGPTFGVEATTDGSTVYLLLQASDHPVGVWRLTTVSPKPELFFPLNQIDGGM